MAAEHKEAPAAGGTQNGDPLDLNDWDPFGLQVMAKNTVIKVMGETHRLAVWNLPSDQETKKEKQILYLPGVKAFSLHWDDLTAMVKDGFWVTGKTDGIRALLKIEKYAVYLLSRTAGVWRMKNKRAEKELQEAFPNTLLDGELLPTPMTLVDAEGRERPGPTVWRFMAFDCVQFKGEPVAHFNFKDRYARVNECVRVMEEIIAARTPEAQAELANIEQCGGVWLNLTTKLWVPAVRIAEVLRGIRMAGDDPPGTTAEAFAEATGLQLTDGLILMNPASHYKHHERNRPLLKWKPEHTIDLIGFFHRRSPGHVYCPSEDEEGLGQTGDWVRLYEYVVVRGNRGPTPGALQIHCVAEEKEELEWLEYVGSAPVNEIWRGLVRHYAQPGIPPRNCLVMEVSLDPENGAMDMILSRADKKTAPNWNQVVKDTLHSLSENITLSELSYIFHNARELFPGSFAQVAPGPAVAQIQHASAAAAAGRKRVHSEAVDGGNGAAESGSSAAAAADGEQEGEAAAAKRLRAGDGSSVAVADANGNGSAATALIPLGYSVPPKPDWEKSRAWSHLTANFPPEALFFLHLTALTLEHWRTRPLLELEARLCLRDKPGAALTKDQFLTLVLPKLLADKAWQKVEFQLIYEESRSETAGKVRVADIRRQQAWFCAQRRRWMVRALEAPLGPQDQAGQVSANMPTLAQMQHPSSLRELQRSAECVRKSGDRLQSLGMPGGSPFAVRVSTKKETPLPKLQAQADEVLRQAGNAPHFLQGILGLADGGRYKSRWSFLRKGIRYDLSEVINNDNHRGRHATYEAEVELLPELKEDPKEGLQAPEGGLLYNLSHLLLAHKLYFKVQYILGLLPQQRR